MEGVDFEARVVGQDKGFWECEAGGEGFDDGVGLEGGAGFVGDRQVGVAAQIFDFPLWTEDLAHFVGFVRVGGSKQEFGHGNRVMKSAEH